MANQKPVSILAFKLGLGENEKIVSKAAELERILQSKLIAGSNLTDTAKVVICLNIAAAFFGVGLDLKTAIKYSGLKSPSYVSSLKIIENLLEVNTEKLTVSSLCLTLQCTAMEDLAEKILKEYLKKTKMEVDLNLPQYVCMAVYHACRINKVKISKSKIIEKSRLKLAQWAKLETDWMKYVNEDIVTSSNKRGGPTKNVEEITANENMDVDCQRIEEKDVTKLEMESYEDWKQRMLELAHKEVDEIEMKMEKTQTRKSPRKTPQKLSPYKENPNKAKGVRLLFQV